MVLFSNCLSGKTSYCCFPRSFTYPKPFIFISSKPDYFVSYCLVIRWRYEYAVTFILVISAGPPGLVAITGLLHIIASITAFPKGSPNVGKQKMSVRL
jgi:hypothetical protein